MLTILLAVVLPSLILFFFVNLAARELFLRLQEKKKQAEREEALAESLRLDFTRESKTLKRVEVKDPEARILCVDDEEVILDSFRKILVLDGYCVDTVETGQEALGLVQTRDYDFVFTDLKMPAMSGTDVAKSVKHLRPDIDVVIITGFATVESAVECMKHGAVDYVEKPFTEQELRLFVKQALIRRRDRIRKQLKPRVHILDPAESERGFAGEFSIPGGVLISSGHCWSSLADDGSVKIGLDDFAKKLLGSISTIEFPNIGTYIKAGQPLFSVNQGHRRAQFSAPLSGKVVKINEGLGKHCGRLEVTSYGKNWICVIEGDDLDAELPLLKIGKSAVTFFQEEMDRFLLFAEKVDGTEVSDPAALCIGAIEKMDDAGWDKAVKEFFTA
jgi:FixJ family two-component response regulator/glycine cleavage system H lipoate-binding protein